MNATFPRGGNASRRACWLPFFLFLLAGAGTAVGAPALPRRLGTNDLVAGRALPFLAPLTPYARAQAGGLGTNVTVARGVLVLPDDWEFRKPVPLMVICSSSGSAVIPQLAAYTNAAMAEGWAVLAADGPGIPADKDTVLWNWGLVESAIEFLQRSIPQARTWPVAVAGFSGGAKRASCVAAALAQARRPLLGLFLGGCNEDRATTGALLFNAGPPFLGTPVFLSSGNEDSIAGPAYAAVVKARMEATGFSHVRLETYPGGHRLNERHLREALRWFSTTK